MGLTLITGNGIWDALGTAMIGVLLVAIAVVLAVETKSLLLGESATKDDVAKDPRAPSRPTGPASSTSRPCTLAPRNCSSRPRSASTQSDTGQDIAQAIDDAEQRIRAAVPIARVIYLEPDVHRVTSAS